MSCLVLQPPEIKSFIEKVIQSPLSDIAIPLSGFRWEYSKVTILIHTLSLSLFFLWVFSDD